MTLPAHLIKRQRRIRGLGEQQTEHEARQWLPLSPDGFQRPGYSTRSAFDGSMRVVRSDGKSAAVAVASSMIPMATTYGRSAVGGTRIIVLAAARFSASATAAPPANPIAAVRIVSPIM